MTLNVLLFAALRDASGGDTVAIDLAPGATVADLRQRLAEALPATASLLARSQIAVNHEFAEDDAVIPPGAEIAVIPPVSGG